MYFNRKLTILCLTVYAIATTSTLGQLYDDDDILMYVELESSCVLPSSCQEEWNLPARALSGQQISRKYLCGDQFFDKCNNVIDYIFREEYTDEERLFVGQILKAFSYSGAEYFCGIAQEAINDIMNKGGSECIFNSSTTIDYCSYVSVVRFETSQPLESICKTLDYAFDCNLKSISACELKPLNDLWKSYYEYIITRSPCNKYSKWGNIYPIYSAAPENKNYMYFGIIAIWTLSAIRFLF